MSFANWNRPVKFNKNGTNAAPIIPDGTENNTANGTFQDSYNAARIKNTNVKPRPRINMVCDPAFNSSRD